MRDEWQIIRVSSFILMLQAKKHISAKPEIVPVAHSGISLFDLI